MKTFDSFGAFARAAVLAEKNPIAFEDAHLVRAPTGAGEVDPIDGGFLVDPTFVDQLVSSLYTEAIILPHCTQISNNPRGVKVPAIDESSRANGARFGGVASAWMNEGNGLPASIPKFRLMAFSPTKLMAIAIVTTALLEDVSALGKYLQTIFASEFAFLLDLAIFSGTGVGQPLGILNAPATIIVPKETGQASTTITSENIDKLWQCMPAPCRRRAVWLVSEDVDSQLAKLSLQVGTGGSLAANAGSIYVAPGVAGNATALLKGRPVFEVEQASQLGVPGDIVLADLSQYYVNAAALKSKISLHVKFLTDEIVFKFVLRVDGKPIWTTPITPFNGTQRRSPFVTLAAR